MNGRCTSITILILKSAWFYLQQAGILFHTTLLKQYKIHAEKYNSIFPLGMKWLQEFRRATTSKRNVILNDILRTVNN